MTLLQILLILLTLGGAITLVYRGRSFWALLLLGAGMLALWQSATMGLSWLFAIAVVIYVGLAVIFGLPVIRCSIMSKPLMRLLGQVLPKIGDTERIALEAGSVWWDGELFSGAPAWDKMLDFPIQALSEEEQAFLDGPVETLCQRLNEWQIQQAGDLSSEDWRFLREHGFFGMIIPKHYGGLGFSAAAHSAVITKLASRSATATVTTMVPNSLGPAELLLHYGTEEQKEFYLPRLATGQELPCFALTGPESGSDAAATQSTGLVCHGEYDGEQVLGIRLNWRKRYITLAPVATVIGLAFRLLDPEHLLGDQENLGITCALVPAQLPGIDIGERHDPMGIPFWNGPTLGHDVFVPVDFIIGGRAMAGQGWRMLMESLAAGRSISLPALSVGGAQLATRVVGAYATVREQFDTPIGRFEGIEEPLARIGGLTYLLNAARSLTAGAVDSGEKPAVVSAIVKCYMTDTLRSILNDAMDIRAGASICLGPRNILARLYMAAPIGITVEGANILTRSMIIYGQGAIRCHPFVQEQLAAVAENDVVRFDRAFFGHMNFVAKNSARALLLGISNGRLARVPAAGELRSFMQAFTRMSAAFALSSDVAMAVLGGRLKRMEKISGRLADTLAWLYLGSAAMKKFHDEGEPDADRALFCWACQQALYQIQQALLGVVDNFPNRAVAWCLKRMLFPFGTRYRPPSDALGAQVAQALLDDSAGRQRLTADIYIPTADEIGLGRLEAALDQAVPALAVEKKIRAAIRAGKIDRLPGDALLAVARAADIITAEEQQQVLAAETLRDEVIQVDAFAIQVKENQTGEHHAQS